MEERKDVINTVGHVRCSDLDRLSLEQVIELFKSKMPEGSVLDYDYDDEFSIIINRKETEEEFNRRIENQNRTAKFKEDRERETLRQLKEKYEGTN